MRPTDSTQLKQPLYFINERLIEFTLRISEPMLLYQCSSSGCQTKIKSTPNNIFVRVTGERVISSQLINVLTASLCIHMAISRTSRHQPTNNKSIDSVYCGLPPSLRIQHINQATSKGVRAIAIM